MGLLAAEYLSLSYFPIPVIAVNYFFLLQLESNMLQLLKAHDFLNLCCIYKTNTCDRMWNPLDSKLHLLYNNRELIESVCYGFVIAPCREDPMWTLTFNSYTALYCPLQAASGSGSPWTRPSKCCRATNPSTPSTCGGSSSAAPQPTGTPSSRAHRRTTTTPITAPPPPLLRRAACWAPPADRTAPKPHELSPLGPFAESLYSLAWI